MIKRNDFMNNHEEWNEFLENLVTNAIAGHKDTKEYEYLRARQKHIDEFLTSNLTVDQKTFMEEILFEIGVSAERQTEVVYRQGLKDCVWLLKNLGVLA